MIALLALACGGEAAPPSEDPVLWTADYAGLEEGRSWVYRDDVGADGGDTGIPGEAELLRAQVVESGEVELRRGERWADAERTGRLRWSLEDGLALIEWDLPGGDGEGSYPIAYFNLYPGAYAADGGWSCIGDPVEETTFYGTFEDAYAFHCQGDDGPAGRYVFARGIGLVRLEWAEYALELVAPW